MGDMADHFREMEEQDLFERHTTRAMARKHGLDKPTWHNALGEEVDLDDIDREYALNIYTHRLVRGASATDALSQKLREVILSGRDPGFRDRQRAQRYNNICAFKGLPWRAVFKDLHKDG